ncbi:DUF1624 domain-containing protein [Flavihumibacter profundi]|uniref:DUF1624 domain-containing protein n=1 Tax=Flavihumibacter profundi TaxID=2716883 RepID=UPI001CC46C2D|nr:heparan-alpha-glucosaminide N-acetyltransferase domain-containing protein [Flavihumibacter profundi]MBZ5859572.1 heparan-alpha-glucosaminide N-acetyltransferase domain-containing protein [Flavihumibacter profundi]
MELVKKARIQSIDLLRGIIMVIMALDHCREYFHASAGIQDPLDLATTTPTLFFTRWITHLCAPIFVFLSGVSAWLQSGRKTTRELSSFLITRGLWLIFVDLFFITFATTANLYFSTFVIQTLWAIGISMAVLGLMIWLPYYAILATGLLIVVGHNALDIAELNHSGSFPAWWMLLHKHGNVPLWEGHNLLVFYPFLPWTGLMLLGYCAGRIFTNYEGKQRRNILLSIGLNLLLFFAAVRFTNIYGDPLHWSVQKDGLYTFLSFMNVQKYPPSLMYMAATIGIGFIFLALVKNAGSGLSKIFIVYGRVPMFYYVVHFYLLSIINTTLFFVRGHSFAEGMTGIPGTPWKFLVAGEGFNLAMVYVIWISLVTALYPLCRWYDKYKSSHPEKKWLSYL